MPGDIFGSHNSMCYWHLVGRGQEAAKYREVAQESLLLPLVSGERDPGL